MNWNKLNHERIQKRKVVLEAVHLYTTSTTIKLKDSHCRHVRA